MATKDLGPLDWRVAITDRDGRPTPEFQRRWNTQRTNNSGFGTLSSVGVQSGTLTVTNSPLTEDGVIGIELPDTAVTPGSYTNADITVDAHGRITAAAAGSGGGGTVTSVALSAPGIFTVTGPPVTSSGTLTFALKTQAANLIWAGPTTGTAAAPTFRSLVYADLPTSGVTAGTYGSSTTVGQFTVNSQGVITSAASVAISGGGGGGAWVPLTTGATRSSVFPTPLQGLTLSAAGSTANFGVAAGACCDSTGSTWMVLPSALALNAAAIDTGAIANNTWYHVFLIAGPGKTTTAIFSLSATSPTMPVGYTFNRRIGAMKTNGSAQWSGFRQIGSEFLWAAPVQDVTNIASSNTPATRVLSTPLGVVTTAILTVQATTSSGSRVIFYTYPLFASATSGRTVIAAASIGTDGMLVPAQVLTDTASSIGIVSETNAGSSGLGSVITYGWVEDFTQGLVSQTLDDQPQFVTDGAGNLIMAAYSP